MPVYFVQAGRFGPIKIGYAADPAERLVGLQTAHYEVLRLVAVMPGTASDERDLHSRFARHRIRGEWFAICAGIADLIERFETREREQIGIEEIDASGLSSPVIGTLDALIAAVGSQKRLAQILGMSPASLNNAKSRGALQRRDAVRHRHTLTNHGLNVSWKVWGIEAERAA